jgi:hypothetical protein
MEILMPSEKLTVEGLMYDWFTDEASRLAQRTDWFLIAHGILLEAFFSGEKRPVAATIIGSVGSLAAWLWLMVGWRQRWLLRHLGDCMEREELVGKDASGLFRRLFEVRRAGLPWALAWARPTPTFSVVLPAAFVLAWISLVTVDNKPWWVGTCWAVGTIFVGTLLTTLTNRGPKISREFVDKLISRQHDDGSSAG